jgi:copper-binding protein NosD/parallel beta helix pectate lyase-like protein
MRSRRFRAPRPLPVGAFAVLALLLVAGVASAGMPRRGGGPTPHAVVATLTIRPDGSVSTAGILGLSGVTYRLLTPYNGSIADERNGSILDGAGRTVNYSSGSAAVTVFDAVNVTVENFHLLSTSIAAIGVFVLNSSVVRVMNDTIATIGPPVEVASSASVVISNNTAPSTGGMALFDSSNVAIEDNNLATSTGTAVSAVRVTGLTLLRNDGSHAAGNALNLAYVDSLVVGGNRLDRSGAGTSISFTFVEQGNVSHNNLSQTSSAVFVDLSANLSFWNNTVSSATLNPYDIQLSSGIAIIDSVATSASSAGAFLQQDVGVTLLRVDFANSIKGVDVENSSGVRIQDSRLGGAVSSVYCYGTSDLTIAGSDLSDPQNGLYAIQSSSLTVRNSFFGLANYPINLTGGTHDVLVVGSNLDNAQIGGVYLNNVYRITVDNSTIRSDAQYAVSAVATQGLTISSTNLSGTATKPGLVGIHTVGDSGVSLLNDTIQWTQSPILDDGTDGLRVVGTDLSNETGSLAGLSISNDQHILVAGSDFFGDTGQGITGFRFTNLTVSHSNFGRVQFDGLDLLTGTDVRVTSNTFDNEGGTAVYFASATGLLASGNSLNNDSYAFYLQGGTGEQILGNTALIDRDGGLAATNVNGFLVAGNNFSGDSAPGLTALGLTDVAGFSITGNTLAQDDRALYVVGTSSGTIVGNRVQNDNVSFDIEGSVDAELYHNDFVQDAGWVLSNTPTLSWDNGFPNGGNFWSNYTGPDLLTGLGQNLPGADGLGDHPEVLTPANIDRYPLMTPWTDHAALFVETGLPLATPWTVVFNGTAHTAMSNTITVSSSVGSRTPFTFSIPTVLQHAASPSSGSGTLGAGLVMEAVTFAVPAYPLTFTESGLPIGTNWAVVLDTTSLPNSGATVTENLPNGTYDYSVASVPGFSVVPSKGTVTVTGGPQAVAVTYTAFTFPVSIVEIGLPPQTSWGVKIGSNASGTTLAALTLQLTNGSYTFTVTPITGYTSTPRDVTWRVSGGPATFYVSFVANTSSSPGPGKNSVSYLSQSLLPYEVAIAILAVLAAVGWFLAVRRRPPRSPEVPPPATAPPTPPPGAA